MSGLTSHGSFPRFADSFFEGTADVEINVALGGVLICVRLRFVCAPAQRWNICSLSSSESMNLHPYSGRSVRKTIRIFQNFFIDFVLSTTHVVDHIHIFLHCSNCSDEDCEYAHSIHDLVESFSVGLV